MNCLIIAEVVEQDRMRFNMSDEELNGRKNFVSNTRKRLNEIKVDLTKEKQIKQVRKSLHALYLKKQDAPAFMLRP
jgi:hypothetical protein